MLTQRENGARATKRREATLREDTADFAAHDGATRACREDSDTFGIPSTRCLSEKGLEEGIL